MERSQLSAPAGVDRFDWEIVTFVVSWAPYGRPDEEVVMPRFGLTCQQLEERFCVCVSNLTVGRHLRLNREQREVLKQAIELLAPVGAESERGRGASTAESAFTLSAADGQWVPRRSSQRAIPRRRVLAPGEEASE